MGAECQAVPSCGEVVCGHVGVCMSVSVCERVYVSTCVYMSV